MDILLVFSLPYRSNFMATSMSCQLISFIINLMGLKIDYYSQLPLLFIMSYQNICLIIVMLVRLSATLATYSLLEKSGHDFHSQIVHLQ